MPRSYKCVIFDCDGTLVDSEPISLRVLVDMVAREGLEIPHDYAVERWSGCDLLHILGEVESRLGRELAADFPELFREQQLVHLEQEVQPIDGAAELIEAVRASGMKYCVASNAPMKKVRLCLETTGLFQYFDDNRVFSAHQVQKWKPDPDVFLFASRRLDVAPEDCCVIEDSGYGVEAALAAGMDVVYYQGAKDWRPPEHVRQINRLASAMPLVVGNQAL